MSRVVVTGVGIVSASGTSPRGFFDAILSGKSAIGPVDFFDVSPYSAKIGAIVDLSSIEKSTTRSAGLPRGVRFLEHAVGQALGDHSFAPDRIGCALGTPTCSLFEVEEFVRTGKGNIHYSLPERPIDWIAQRFGLLGPRLAVSNACTSSAISIGMALKAIRLGQADAMVAGGADGFSEIVFSGFSALQSLSAEPCRPFDGDRNGLTLGEGAGILLLESEESATRRGAQVLAEVVGFAVALEAYNLTAPREDASGYQAAIRETLADAGIGAADVDYVNAHGTGTQVNDRIEAQAISTLIGSATPVSSIKGAVGHCLGAAGAVEAVASVLAIREGVIPGTTNCTRVDPSLGIRVELESRKADLKHVLSLNAGFGSTNSGLLFRKWEG